MHGLEVSVYSLAQGKGIKRDVMGMPELRIVLQTVGIVVLRNHTHTHSPYTWSHTATGSGFGEVGRSPRLLIGLLKCFCHQHSVACITASPALGTRRRHVSA